MSPPPALKDKIVCLTGGPLIFQEEQAFTRYVSRVGRSTTATEPSRTHEPTTN